MSKHLNAYARTVIAIRNDGTTSVSIPVLIMQHTGHTWAKPDLVNYLSAQLKRIAEVVREITKATLGEPLHLVSEPFFLQGYDKLNPPIPDPRRKERKQAERQAQLCLPIGKRSYGIRFVDNRYDFLLNYWHAFVYESALNKTRIREELIILDDKKEKLPVGEAKRMLEIGRQKMVPFGGYSPVIIPTDLRNDFMSNWQRNFMRK